MKSKVTVPFVCRKCGFDPVKINVDLYAGRSPAVIEKVAARMTDAVCAELSINPADSEIDFHELHRGNHFEGGKRAGPDLGSLKAAS